MKKLLATAMTATVLLFAMSGLVPSVAETAEPNLPIGTYTQFWSQNELSEDHISFEAGALEVTGPAFTSELRLERSFLQAELGAWAALEEFSPEGELAVFGGSSTTIFPLEIGAAPVFTWGHPTQLGFLERPMWVSAQQAAYGEAITLSIEDGDETGQSIYVSKAWLWERGIPFPAPVHEDGTNLTVTSAADRKGYIIDVHHFSDVIINPDGLSVLGRQGGLTFPHPDGSRWLAQETRLEIPVGDQLSDYGVLAGKDWIDFHIPDLALEEFAWEIEEYNGNDYYLITLSAADSPTSLVYRKYSPGPERLFSRGSDSTVRFSVPIATDSTISGSALNITFYGPETLGYVRVNGSFLVESGITHPRLTSSVGDGLSWTVPALTHLETGIPPNATWLSISQPQFPSNYPSLLQLLDETLGSSELCQAAYGEGTPLQHLYTWTQGGSSAWLFVWGTTFCFEWNLYLQGAYSYNTIYAVVDAEGYVSCGGGNDASGENDNRRNLAFCEWPDGEEFPAGEILYAFVGTANTLIEPDPVYEEDAVILTGVACLGGAVVTAAAAAVTVKFAPAALAVKYAAGFTVSHCVALVVAVGYYVIWEDEEIRTDVILVGDSSSGGSVIGENKIRLIDENDMRLDTWNLIEDNFDNKKPYYEGLHELAWTLRDVYDGEFVYSSDLSTPKWMKWNGQRIDLLYYDGGAEGKALVTTFPNSAMGYGNSEAIRTRYQDNINPSLDWEAPEPACVLVQKIVSTTGWLDFVNAALPMDCLNQNQLLEPTGPDEPWMEFTLYDHELQPGVGVNSTGSISKNDVLAEGGNITRAIAKRFVSNGTFVDGISHVVLPARGIGELNCEAHQEPYQSTFTAMVSGITIAGHLMAMDDSTFVGTICFDPLYITSLVEDD